MASYTARFISRQNPDSFGRGEPLAPMLVAPPPGERVHLVQVAIRHILDQLRRRGVVRHRPDQADPLGAPDSGVRPVAEVKAMSWSSQPSVTTASLLSRTRYSPRAACKPWLIAAGNPRFSRVGDHRDRHAARRRCTPAR